MQETVGTFELVLGGSILIFIISCFFIILYYYFSRKIIISKLQQNHLTLEHQKELLKNEIAVIEKERKRIARDLHDEIGANMAYIGINLAQLAKECPNIESFNEKFIVCQTQLNQAITDVRRISHDLLPPILEMFGLIPAIQEFINNLNTSFEIDFTYDETFNQLNQETALQLYRVLLELISNTIKHSGGDKITIHLIDHSAKRKISYSDNGLGFDFCEKKNSKGLGLKNIISRLESIDAKYSCNTASGNGFQLDIEINENAWKDIH
jgi:two-component system NarL family sensor kinase